MHYQDDVSTTQHMLTTSADAMIFDYWLLVPSVLWRCWLGGRKGIRPIKTEWWGAGVAICLEQAADLHMAQLMPLPPTVSCFSKIQIGSTFLVPAHLGSPGKRSVILVCVCVCVRACVRVRARSCGYWLLVTNSNLTWCVWYMQVITVSVCVCVCVCVCISDSTPVTTSWRRISK